MFHLATLDFYFFTFKMDQKICLVVLSRCILLFILLFLFFQLILARIFGFKSVGFKKNGAFFWDIPIDFDFFSPVFWI